MLSIFQRRKIASSIKRDLERAFPGYVVKSVTVRQDGSYTVTADDKKSIPDHYHLYPNLTKEEADDQIIRDMEAIIRRHLPGTVVTGFDQDAHDGFRHVDL
jgi:hypothetical protein